jgi:TonB-linked SusC/RagA family outer membrane protein
MKKDYFSQGRGMPFSNCKILKIMKLTVFMMLFVFQQIFALEGYSQADKLNLNLKNNTLKEVFKMIEEHSEYSILYDESLLENSSLKSGNYSNRVISEILDELLVNEKLRYQVIDKMIVIVKNDANKFAKESIAQENITLKGKVIDHTGEPIVGANVVIKGTTNGTITNIDGEYVLVVGSDDEVVFSFIGYESQTINVNGRERLDITLMLNVHSVNEVVVTALGIERETKTLTYAAQEVGGEELTKARDINFMNSLNGKAAGVEVQKSGSGAGGSTKVILRGNKSILGASEPLYVIDGVPMANNKPSQAGMWGGSEGGDGLALINPEDIESISILKGSNASVLYGSQGANGVVLITTKSGKSGKAVVNVNSGITFENVHELPDLQFRYGRIFDDNNNPEKESWSSTKGSYQDNYVDDFFKTGTNYINTLSISGGNENTTAYFSYGNTTSKGVTPTNKYDKHNLSFKQSTKLFKDKLTVTSNVLLSNEKSTNRNPAGYYINPFFGLYTFGRDADFTEYKDNYQVFNADRNMYVQNWVVASDQFQSNPYWILHRQPKTDKVNRVVANLSLSFDLYKDLKLQLRGNYDYAVKSFETQHSATSNLINVHPNGAWDYRRFTDELLYGDAIFTYNKKINNFSVNAVAGASYQRTLNGVGVRVSSGITGLVYPNHFSFQNLHPDVMVQSTYGGKVIKQGVFGNVQFGYKDMIFLDISGRNDWASTLAGTGNDSYFYPAIGVSALLSEMIELPDFINFAKVRSSYTRVANEVPFNMVDPQNTITSAGISRNTTKPFTNLKPEMLTSFEIGTDWRFVDGRLGFDFTYYNINSKDQFLNLPAPSGSGWSRYFVNAGEIRNWGVELSLKLVPIRTADFTYEAEFNYSHNKDEIITIHEDFRDELARDDTEGYKRIIKRGGRLDDIYVYKFLRDDQGRIMLNEDGALQQTEEQEYIGNANPDWNLGWNNNIRYKDFSLSFLFSGKFGGKVVSKTEAMLDGYGVSERTAQARDAGKVNINGVKPNGSTVSEMAPRDYYAWTGGRNGILEPYTYDRTNIRLAQLSLAYNFNLAGSKIPIDNLNVSLVGQNLFFLYNDAPFDPEVLMNTSGSFPALDNFGLPATKTYGFNVKVTF